MYFHRSLLYLQRGSWTLWRSNRFELAPGIAVPSLSHYQVSGVVPVTVALKVALAPMLTDWLAGCRRMAGWPNAAKFKVVITNQPIRGTSSAG